LSVFTKLMRQTVLLIVSDKFSNNRCKCSLCIAQKMQPTDFFNLIKDNVSSQFYVYSKNCYDLVFEITQQPK